MDNLNKPSSSATAVVNYTTVLTSAPNEIYVSTTQSPDCLSNLIKNNVTIEFSIVPDINELIDAREKNSTSVR